MRTKFSGSGSVSIDRPLLFGPKGAGFNSDLFRIKMIFLLLNCIDYFRQIQDSFISGVYFDLLTHLRDVLNCELVIKEEEEGLGLDHRAEDELHLRNLVDALSAFAHASGISHQHSSPDLEDRVREIFDCVNTHGTQLLRSPKVTDAILFILKY